MNTKRPLFIILITLALLGLSFSRALAKEITGATLSGPGIPGEIALSDGQDIDVASAPWREFLPADKPEGLQNASYYVVRLEISAEGEVARTVAFHYYPGEGDQPSYAFYADCQGCSGSYQTWIGVGREQDLALRELLVRLGAPATLIGGAEQTITRLTSGSPSEPGGNSSLAPLFRQNILLLGFLALLLLSLITFAFLRNRTNKSALDG